MSTQPKPVGPTAMPASRKITTSGTLVSRARRPLTVPSIRMSPKTISACLACSIDTADSMRRCPFGSHPCRRTGGCRWPVAAGAAVYRERSAAGLRGQGDPPGSRGEPSTAKARQGAGGSAGSGRIPRVLAGGERSGGVGSVVVGEAGGIRADRAAGLAAAIEIAPILTAAARHAAAHNRNTHSDPCAGLGETADDQSSTHCNKSHFVGDTSGCGADATTLAVPVLMRCSIVLIFVRRKTPWRRAPAWWRSRQGRASR